MSFRSYVQSVRRWLAGDRPPRRQRPWRLEVEALEPRLTPSAQLLAGQLLISGGPDASPDKITLVRMDSDYVVHQSQGGTVLPDSSFPINQAVSISIDAGDGDDEITVEINAFTNSYQGVKYFTPVTILGGAGNDKILLNPASKDLTDGLSTQNFLFVDGGGGSDRLEVNDQNAQAGAYRVTVTGLEIHPTMGASDQTPRSFTYISVEDLVLDTATSGPVDGAVFIDSTAANSAVTVNAGRVYDVFDAGTPTAGLNGLRGTAVNFIGRGGNTLNVDDRASGAGQTYYLYASAVQRPGAARINFTGVGNVPVHGGDHGDTFFVLGTPAAGTTVAVLGHGGSDSLDYSSFPTSFPTGVQVDLAALPDRGTATALGGGVFGVENVTGSVYGDALYGDGNSNILVGLGGDDTLDGRAGRDLLIGGAGSDNLTGGTEEDVVIGGTTSYDNRWTTVTYWNSFLRRYVTAPGFYLGVDYVALQSILTAWQSPGTQSQRMTLIGSGVGPNGQYKLDATTVQSGGVSDLIQSSAGDWVWR
jgi:Ca2+-binding RTX toxin-like protein